ncbi:MAG: HD domain-containing phosphohydrolase [Bacteriovoracia bacterium]
MTKSRRILLVDDDAHIVDSLKNILEEAGFEVMPAYDGKSAQSIFSLHEFSAVISDIQMPKFTGFELAQSLKRQRNVPFIMMTGLREYIDTISEYSTPIDGFLAKPFKRDELLETLARCLDELPSISAPNLDGEFMKLSLEDFVSGKQIQSDIYIRMNETKYLKIAHQGEDLEVHRIRAYREKNVRHLYMKKADFSRYVGFSLKLSEGVKNAKIEPDRKARFFKHTGEIILEQLHMEGVDEDTFADSKVFLENSLEVISEDAEAFNLLDMLNQHSNFLYAHSLAVSFFSLMLAKTVGWNSPANRFKISLAGLYHDIGKKELDLELLSKSRRQMSHGEIKLYEEHCSRGVDLMRDLKSIPTEVLQVILHHHENCIGSGFPSKLGSKHVHPIAKLVAVVDEFVKLTLEAPNSPRYRPTEAIKIMEDLYSQILDKQYFPALKKLFSEMPRQRRARAVAK